MSRTLQAAVAFAIVIAALLIAIDRYQVITERQRADQERANQTLTAPTRQIVATLAALDTDVEQNFGTLTAIARRNEVADTRAAGALTQLAQVRTEQARSDLAATVTVETAAVAQQATVTAIIVEANRLGTETVRQLERFGTEGARQVQATFASSQTNTAATVATVLTPRP